MKFFTADLLERFGSDHDHIALAAQSELEQRAEEYSRSLGEVELELPQRFRELLDRYYLHDAQVMEHSRLGNVENLSIADPELGACSTRWKPVEQIDGRLLSFWIVLAGHTAKRRSCPPVPIRADRWGRHSSIASRRRVSLSRVAIR
jgi:hypothetical protein